jgi:hypothetical protein
MEVIGEGVRALEVKVEGAMAGQEHTQTRTRAQLLSHPLPSSTVAAWALRARLHAREEAGVATCARLAWRDAAEAARAAARRSMFFLFLGRRGAFLGGKREGVGV